MSAAFTSSEILSLHACGALVTPPDCVVCVCSTSFAIQGHDFVLKAVVMRYAQLVMGPAGSGKVS